LREKEPEFGSQNTGARIPNTGERLGAPVYMYTGAQNLFSINEKQ
jgi:hypothetical protein